MDEGKADAVLAQYRQLKANIAQTSEMLEKEGEGWKHGQELADIEATIDKVVLDMQRELRRCNDKIEAIETLDAEIERAKEELRRHEESQGDRHDG